MIGRSGPVCDVCGKYILPLGEEMVHTFRVGLTNDLLCCDNACRKILEEISATDKDWKRLPDGPLKNAYRHTNEAIAWMEELVELIKLKSKLNS